MLKKLKLLVIGPIIMVLGGFSLAAKFLLPDARLPFWPFDGILAILGGAFVTYWCFIFVKES